MERGLVLKRERILPAFLPLYNTVWYTICSCGRLRDPYRIMPLSRNWKTEVTGATYGLEGRHTRYHDLFR